MNRLARRGAVSVNRVGPFRCAAILVAVIGALLAAPPAPAHADVFGLALSVNGGRSTVEVVKQPGARVRIEWNLPAVAPAGRTWHLFVGTRALTCTADDSGALVFERHRLSAAHGSMDLDLSGPDFPAGASYYVRMCLPLDSGQHHLSNQVGIRLVTGTIVGTRPAIPLPGLPQITGILAATPVRPGYMIGVIGRDFGERPGRLLLDTGTVAWDVSVSDGDWHSRAIAGRISRTIAGVRDGPAFLVVERADGSRSRWSVNFVARREVRLVPGGEVYHLCSQEADENRCWSAVYSGAPSFEGKHRSYIVTAAGGERGTDQFSVALANGWRFHELEWSHGLDEDRPSWTIRGRETDHPSFHVGWSNPPGFGVHFYYGFRLYIVGPVGVPHR